jgi:hypothetical protein
MICFGLSENCHEDKRERVWEKNVLRNWTRIEMRYFSNDNSRNNQLFLFHHVLLFFVTDEKSHEFWKLSINNKESLQITRPINQRLIRPL